MNLYACADHFLSVWLLHVIKEVYHTAIDAPNFPWHRLRYGPKEIQGTRDETEKARDSTQGGDQSRSITFYDLENWRENVPA